jgi:hypothetical protein
MTEDATGWQEQNQPTQPVATVEGPKSATGRSAAILLGAYAVVAAGVAIAAWEADAGSQVACSGSAVQVLDIPSTGLVTSAIMLLAGLAISIVSLWRKPHRIAAVVAIVVGLVCLLLIIGAISFHHEQTSSCWNF